MRVFSARGSLLVVLMLTGPLLGACDKRAATATVNPAQVGITWTREKAHLFDLELTTTTQLSGAPAAPPVVLKAGMELSFRDEAGSQQALVQLREPRLLEGAGRPANNAATFEAELAKTFAVELSRGIVKAYFEPPSVAATVVGFRRHLVAALQFGEHASTGTWTSSEWDATGLSEVEYRAVAGAERRWDWKKIGYERVVSTQQRAAGSIDTNTIKPEVVHSSGQTVADASGIVSVSRDETLSVPVSDSTKLTTHLVLKLERKGFGPPMPASQRQQNLKDLLRAEVGTPAAIADQKLIDQARIGAHTFPEVVASFSALEAKQGGAPASAAEAGPLFHALVAILRQQPENVAAAIKLVRARSPITNTLIDALGMASTAQSLESLSALALDTSLQSPVRLRAVGSFIRAQQPGQTAFELAVKMLKEPLLRENALYGIGSFVRQLRERGEPVLADAGVQVLAQQLKSSATAGDRATTLMAISNSGSPELYDAAVAYQADSDSSVRQAAIQAIRLMPQAEAETRLREVLGRKERGDVLAALHALGRRPHASRESVDRVESIARRDPSPELRREAVLVLGFWSQTWPALVPVLAEIQASDTDQRVREVAKPAGSP